MAGFGKIHDLSSLEISIRRELGVALHSLNCARNFIGEYNVLDRDKINQLEKMLIEAESSVKLIVGE